MANEINANLNLTINDSGNSVSGGANFQANYSGAYIGVEVTIPTTATLLDLGGVTSPVAVLIKNLDSTNFVQVDIVSAMTSWPQKLHPGQCVALLPESGTIYCKADTASCKILVVAG